MQCYLIHKGTKAAHRVRQVHIINSMVGKTEEEINKWIVDNRKRIEKIVNIKFECKPTSNGDVKTKVFVDYIENTNSIKHSVTSVKVKEVSPKLIDINGWLASKETEIEVGGIRVVDLSEEMADEYFVALIDYQDK
jgi:hypothetical protein